MSFSIEFDASFHQARIKVIGVGNSGANALDAMIRLGIKGVDFVAVNTDAQALGLSAAPERFAIGQEITRGLGAGADQLRGRDAALEDRAHLERIVSGADMVIIATGMGGGTGTGAAPLVAQLAHDAGALTVGIVTEPFSFEGTERTRRAEQGTEQIFQYVDTLITIRSESVIGGSAIPFVEAFRKADEVMAQAVKSIADLITLDGIVNVDFADVRTVLAGNGLAFIGIGLAKGEGRARLAAEQAIHSPLLDDISMRGATGVLINIVGGSDMKMKEIQEAASVVQAEAHEDANIIFGASIDEELGSQVKVTLVATGFRVAEKQGPTSEHSRRSLPRAEAPSARPAVERSPTEPLSLYFNLDSLSPEDVALIAETLANALGEPLRIVASGFVPPTESSQGRGSSETRSAQ